MGKSAGASRVRGILLASAAGAALIVAANNTGLTELTPWATGAALLESWAHGGRSPDDGMTA